MGVVMFRRGKREYEAPRFMTVDIAATQLLEAIERQKDELRRRNNELINDVIFSIQIYLLIDGVWVWLG